MHCLVDLSSSSSSSSSSAAKRTRAHAPHEPPNQPAEYERCAQRVREGIANALDDVWGAREDPEKGPERASVLGVFRVKSYAPRVDHAVDLS